ncbi:phosphatidylglycerophosphatase A family protein [Brachymonas wangyanguii]|uniref:phosphatidylglycerophosphatase A family protein n=1 Tax=Brachymonas TaxID=28219 RepID=UPI003F502B80
MLLMPHSAPQAPRRPDLAFTFSHPAHALALGLGSGLSPKAPGTAGTLFAWASWLLLASWLPASVMWALLLLAIPLGWWACTVTARNMGVQDPGSIVWDEVAAFWLVLQVLMLQLPLPLLSGSALLWQLVAFALFRFFDAAKPQPVRWADQAFKGWGWRGGWGIMFDDLVAALCSVVVLSGLLWLLR